MTTKSKKMKMYMLIFIMIAGLLVLSLFISNPMKAYAASSTYSMEFTYTTKTTTATGGGTSTTSTSGSGYSVTVQTGSSTSCTASLSITASSPESGSQFQMGKYINSNAVNLSINSSISQGTLKVTNSSGTEVGSGNKTLTLSGLADDTYSVAVYFGGGVWTVNSRSGKSVSTSGTSSFIVDSTAPTITGGSTSTTGKYTNSAFTISATDSGSGVKALYYKLPGSSTWSTDSSSSKTISAGSTNGLYSFYAVDNAGNASATYYVNYDNTAPTLSCTQTFSGTTANSFTVSAKDNINTFTLYYKTPKMSSYAAAGGSSYTVDITEPDGKYYFYAVDKLGNTSETKWVELKIPAPTATILKDDSNNRYSITWNDGSSGLLNGSSYASGTWITQENNYTFILTNSANRTSTYTFSISHKYAAVATVSSTCTEQGYTIYECVTCKNRYNSDYVNASGHSLYGVILQPTCTSVGYTTYTCSVCGYQYVSDYKEKIAHSYKEIVYSPTCTETGKVRHVCTECGDEYYTDGATALGHQFTGTILKPTCTTSGYTTYTCSVCKYEYISDFTSATEHHYDDIITDSTCTDAGSILHVCSECGYEYVSAGSPARGHSFYGVILNPTCTEAGYTTYTCSVCDFEYISEIKPAIEHNYEETVIDSTCTETGGVLHTCSNCGDSYITDVTVAMGHSYLETIVEATCEEGGYIRHTCTRCNYIYDTDEKAPTGHSYISSIMFAADCTNDGSRYHECDACGKNYTSVIPCYGHTYEITDMSGEGGVTIRTYTCTTCGHSYTQDLGNQYEEVSNYVGYLFNQYSPYMIYVFIATAAVWSAAMGIALIVAKKNEDREKAKKMVVNYCIGLVVIFIILVAAPLLINGIASLIAA
jgi:hypothetical protein